MARLAAIVAALAAGVVIVGAAAWWTWEAGEEGLPLALGAQLPPIVLRPIEDIEGSGVDLAGSAGKPILLNAFASWCIPCRQEHPLLVEIAGRGDVTLVGINVSDLPESAAAFLDEMGNPYDMVGADPNREAFLRLGLVGIPQTVVVGADGEIVMNHLGPIDRRFVDEVLPSVLGR